jgi:ABC-type uncharacterized transport system substrate-binding protein
VIAPVSGDNSPTHRAKEFAGGGQKERLPKLAAELVALNVVAIVGSIDAALAAKTLTTSIPIVFITEADPVTQGLVSSVNRRRQCDRRQLL